MKELAITCTLAIAIIVIAYFSAVIKTRKLNKYGRSDKR